MKLDTIETISSIIISIFLLILGFNKVFPLSYIPPLLGLFTSIIYIIFGSIFIKKEENSKGNSRIIASSIIAPISILWIYLIYIEYFI